MGIDDLTFDERGLIPCVVQQYDTRRGPHGRVDERGIPRAHACDGHHLVLVARAGALEQRFNGGNIQTVKELYYDCDGDTAHLLVKVDAAGPACHTGATSCFYRKLDIEHD